MIVDSEQEMNNHYTSLCAKQTTSRYSSPDEYYKLLQQNRQTVALYFETIMVVGGVGYMVREIKIEND